MATEAYEQLLEARRDEAKRFEIAYQLVKTSFTLFFSLREQSN